MHNYGEAISRSIASAQTVFTLAGEATAFVDQLQKSSTPEEIRQFLTGMANLAQEGLSNTEMVLAAFKDVRAKLISVSNGIIEQDIVIHILITAQLASDTSAGVDRQYHLPSCCLLRCHVL